MQILVPKYTIFCTGTNRFYPVHVLINNIFNRKVFIIKYFINIYIDTEYFVLTIHTNIMPKSSSVCVCVVHA